jgi:tetratricopeptide (TPR) repeat protein
MPRQLDTAPSHEQIRALRGGRSRAELGELLGVTGLTVYRWELPPEAPEARRPRGSVLARLRAFIEQEAARASPTDSPAASAPAPASVTLEPDERAKVAPPLAAMDDGRLEQAETELLGLLASGALRSEAARALASATLARIQLLARHDTKSAFATLFGVGADVSRLPRSVQLEYHLTAAFLHAHSDAQLFLPGKTNHHVALAEPLIGEGQGDHRFFLWYAQLTAAMSLYDLALIARAMSGFPAVRDLASTALHRCLAEEAMTLSRLGLTSTVDPARDIDGLRTLADARELPLQQIRARIWRAEVMLEGAAPPAQILSLLDDAERRQRRHRVANGIHTMLMNRNRGETLLRIGDRRAAEDLLLEAARVGRELAFTPIRISTTLARLYLLTDRLDDFCELGASSSTSEDVQQDLTRGLAGVLTLLAEVHRGDAAADWADRLLERLAELRRLGLWPMAYRNLVLVSLAVAASKGAVSDAERVLLAAERATEWSTSPTGSATYRRHRATILMRRGRFTEARRSLEAALATFDASGDVAEAALGRRALANVDLLEQRPDADARLRETRDALAALELPAPPIVGADAVVDVDEPAPPTNDDAVERELSFEQLLVPLQRLATRGVGASLLEKELVAIVSELLPGRRVRLEQVDAAGLAKELAAFDGDRAGAHEAAFTWFELSDGVGRRLRLGVGARLHPRQRAALEIVVSAATMALEVAALRGLSAPTADRSEPATDPVPPAIAELVAASPSMRRLRSELGRLSGSRATIIVTGESGTGKEVVARAIHALSRRAPRPYITFNSAAVPRDLFESQLFGHKRGAFTGATADHLGVIRAADGGTLFLDEIGELPLDVQPKLLRFLENGEVLPLGERQPVQVDVRIIAATHRDLLRLVREGRFREDLYYRLQVIPLHIAPLRERRDDILALARHFIRGMMPPEVAAPVLTGDGETKLLAHSWPGNVRELRNVIERSLAFEPVPRLLGAAELQIEVA